MKLLIIGLDGATFDLIYPWAEAGHLPHLARLMQGGAHGALLSTLPPVTSPAWPSFMTGCNPGKHGVFDFIQPSGADFSLVNAGKIKQPTLWQRLSERGYRVGVLNVPVTYPPRPVNGFMVTGILSPKGARICYPPELIGRFAEELGPYRVAPQVQYKAGNEAAFIADVYDLIRAQGEWALALMEAEPVDVMMVHFIALDIMMHALWRFMDEGHPRFTPSPYRDAIRGGYERADQYIGRMLARLPADCHVLVMSDHGFGPLHNIVNLNNFLRQKGFLHLKKDPLTQLKAQAFRWGITPAAVYSGLARLGLQNLATRVSKGTRNQVLGKFLSFDSVDWSRTVAYSMGHVGQVYLNLAGREPQGIVSQADYRRVREEVVAALRTLSDEQGRPLVTQIIPAEESYRGPYAHLGPDLHLVLDEYRVIAYPLFATNGQIVASQIRGDSGCHRREGVFIACGPAIQPGAPVSGSSILDLAPTIMALLGEPVPAIMDGQVLETLFRHPPSVTYSEEDGKAGGAEVALSESESAEIEARLRSLGYL